MPEYTVTGEYGRTYLDAPSAYEAASLYAAGYACSFNCNVKLTDLGHKRFSLVDSRESRHVVLVRESV